MVARIAAETLRAVTAELLRAAGLSEQHADIAADVLVAADLRGVDTHGVSNMLRVYLDWLRSGHVNPSPDVRVVREGPATATLDGDRGLGVVVAPEAMRIAITKAQAYGLGAVTIGNSRHLGMAAYHAMLPLDRGMIGVCTTAVGPLVVPTFGREPRLGTNPIAVAVPTGEEPAFVFDAAMSAIAGNRIKKSYREEKLLPAGSIADEDGHPIMTETVPSDRYDDVLLLPLGSSRESGSHKGYGLAAIVEVLGSALSGTRSLMDLGHGHAAHFLLALDVGAFTDLSSFRASMDRFVRALKATPPVDGRDRVLVAGQLEFEAATERARAGIPLHDEVVAWFHTAAAEAGVARVAELLGRPPLSRIPEQSVLPGGRMNVTTDESWRGKVGRLSDDELGQFLSEPHIARLACLDLEGWPYTVPCWHEWDGRGWWVVPRGRSAWARYLEHDPRCAISVVDEGTQRKVLAQCEAELVERPNVGGRWVPVARRMSVRYLGDNRPRYLEPTLGKPRWLFHLRPRWLTTWQGQDWARRYK